MLSELSRAFKGLELHLIRAAAAEILTALEAGEIELCIAADTNLDWDRLDHWPMFEEGFVLLAPPDRTRSSVSLSAIDKSTVIERPYCETYAASQPAPTIGAGEPRHHHAVSSDEDAAKLVECGMGVAILPESTGRFLAGSVVAIDDFDQMRAVRVYGVAGRQRSPAAGGMLKLLRAADWSTVALH